jgi:peptide/nickel transport system permease protein
MRAYLVSRLGQTLLVVFLSLTAVFFLARLGGDPVLLFLPMDIQAKDLNEFRQRLGFNDPLPVQYARFMSGALRGDFGESLRYKQDALGLVLERLPATLRLGGAALLLTFCLAIPVGVVSAMKRGSVWTISAWGARCWARPFPASGWASCSSISSRCAWAGCPPAGPAAPSTT